MRPARVRPTNAHVVSMPRERRPGASSYPLEIPLVERHGCLAPRQILGTRQGPPLHPAAASGTVGDPEITRGDNDPISRTAMVGIEVRGDLSGGGQPGFSSRPRLGSTQRFEG
jgi:hypothetical protein